MSHLSTAQRAGQVIVAGFAADGPSPGLRELARAGQLAGFILFRRNLRTPRQIAEQNAELLALAPNDLPLWIALDQEGGRVARLGSPVVRLPPMRALGAIDAPELTRRAARVLGQQLGLLGFNLDFAPVLDVDTNPANPVIGDRSFGSHPDLVIRHARAFAAGLQDAGIASCGKHFPGHGDTHTDSHLTLPRLPHARERLDQIELRPFAALGAELPCLMTAHVVFELLDAQQPATLSPEIIARVLRAELGYQGLVFSDDLDMKAVTAHHSVAQAACLAIAGGCDQVLICESEEHALSAHDALTRRAEHDPAFAARLHEAAERSLALRLRYRAAMPRPATVERRLAAQEAAALEAEIQAALSGATLV